VGKVFLDYKHDSNFHFIGLMKSKVVLKTILLFERKNLVWMVRDLKEISKQTKTALGV